MKLEIINKNILKADGLFLNNRVILAPPVEETDSIWSNIHLTFWSTELILKHEQIRKNDIVNTVKRISISNDPYDIELKRIVIVLDELNLEAMALKLFNKPQKNEIIVDLSEFKYYILDNVIEALVQIIGLADINVTLVLSPEKYKLFEDHFPIFHRKFKGCIEDITLSRIEFGGIFKEEDFS